jgi:uncharacterized membrane-anchored protein
MGENKYFLDKLNLFIIGTVKLAVRFNGQTREN